MGGWLDVEEENEKMVLDSFPAHPLTAEEVNAIAQQDRVKNVYGMLISDYSEESSGSDINVGLNVDGGLDHDFFFDLVIDTGDTITVVAYPRPNLPSSEDIDTAAEPIDLITHEDQSWEQLYQAPKPETLIDDVVEAFIPFREFSDREEVWVQGLAHSGVLDFLTD